LRRARQAPATCLARAAIAILPGLCGRLIAIKY